MGENGAAGGGDPENPAGSAMAGDDDEAEQPIDISFPSDGNWKQKLIYIGEKGNKLQRCWRN